MPATPPATIEIMHALAASGEAGAPTLQRILGTPRDAAPGGRYRHWDKLRHQTPPHDLTHEQ